MQPRDDSIRLCWAVEPQPKKLLDEIWGSQAQLVCSLEP